MKKIILTGGGTAGHVTPNIALLPALYEAGYEVTYIGSYAGIEKTLVEEAGVKYIGIDSGKLRRYRSVKNLSDPLRVLRGGREARRALKEIRPDVVFSKGGYVSVPVVLAAERLRIPVIIHESDMSMGLANRIVLPRVRKVCCNFPETLKELPKNKGVLTGSPVREELKNGDRAKGLEIAGFDPADKRSVILVMCGSLGSVVINENIRAIVERLSESYRIIHLCGKEKRDDSIPDSDHYKQLEYADKELPDLMAAADLVVSRAGANSIAEYLTLAKPNLLIPLSAKASRGDQILNAESYRKQGFSAVLAEEDMDPDSLYDAIVRLDKDKQRYIYSMQKAPMTDAVEKIMELLNEAAVIGAKRNLKKRVRGKRKSTADTPDADADVEKIEGLEDNKDEKN